MKHLVFLLILLTFTLGTSGAVLAADSDHGKVKAKFYEFPTLDIEGGRKAPTAIYTSARDKVRFGRLLRLKKSMLPALADTGADKVLK